MNVLSNYWTVGNKQGQVFSAPAAAYVPTTDSGYQAFLAANLKPSSILCDGELADVLLKAGAPRNIVAAAGATSLGNLSPSAAALVLLAIGVVVTSAATPALNGVYGADAASQQDIAAEAQYIAAFGTYSGGQTQLSWLDVIGAAHLFPADLATTKTFMAFARGVADYRTKLSLAAASAPAGQTPSWPSAALAIP